MTAPNQTTSDAMALRNEFIIENVKKFQSNSGDEDFFYLGQAMHPIMDESSPSHEGFKTWNGLGGVPELLEAGAHLIQDFNLFGKDDDKIQTAIGNVQSFYKGVEGGRTNKLGGKLIKEIPSNCPRCHSTPPPPKPLLFDKARKDDY